MSTSGVPGTGIFMVSSITMLYFMAGNTLFRLEIKISSVRTGCMFLVCFGLFFLFLKGQRIFLMHKLPHATFMPSLWIFVREQYLQKRDPILWASDTITIVKLFFLIQGSSKLLVQFHWIQIPDQKHNFHFYFLLPNQGVLKYIK